MKSSKHYLIKALYEWILDNDCTPYLLVNGEGKDVLVPLQYVKDGQIVLNISPFAVKDFIINAQAVFFNARFSGNSVEVYIPIASVMSIYAKENGQGMIFDCTEESDPPPTSASTAPPKATRPALRVIK